jgi:hypothetical protein
MTWNRPVQELRTLLDQAKQWHPSIKFDYQIGQCLPFLDVLVKNQHGLLHTSVYHKPSSEPYITPFQSDHPRHMFGNIIDGALSRAIRYSSQRWASRDFFPPSQVNCQRDSSQVKPSLSFNKNFRSQVESSRTLSKILPKSSQVKSLSKKAQYQVESSHSSSQVTSQVIGVSSYFVNWTGFLFMEKYFYNNP